MKERLLFDAASCFHVEELEEQGQNVLKTRHFKVDYKMIKYANSMQIYRLGKELNESRRFQSTAILFGELFDDALQALEGRITADVKVRLRAGIGVQRHFTSLGFRSPSDVHLRFHLDRYQLNGRHFLPSQRVMNE